MALSPDLVCAINTWFAFRRTPRWINHEGRSRRAGGRAVQILTWPDDRTKQMIEEHVITVAAAHGIAVTIRQSGMLLLACGDDRWIITEPIPPWEDRTQ